MKFGHETLAPGRELLGGFAEYYFLPEGMAIFQVPANVPDLVASPANCATATAAAVFRKAGEVENQTVIVVGAGMLGLTACAMASAANAAQPIAIDINPKRLHCATYFGATVILNGREPADQIRHRVLEVTNGGGADLLLDFSGMPEASPDASEQESCWVAETKTSRMQVPPDLLFFLALAKPLAEK